MLKKTLLAAGFVVLASTGVQANNLMKPEDAVEYRQAIYKIYSAQTGVLGAMVQGKMDFDAAEVNQRAKNIAAVAPMLGETYFPATREVKDSNFKASSWNKMDDVQAKGGAFGKALNELLAASAKPDFNQAQSRKVIGALMQSCKACHDSHRD